MEKKESTIIQNIRQGFAKLSPNSENEKRCSRVYSLTIESLLAQRSKIFGFAKEISETWKRISIEIVSFSSYYFLVSVPGCTSFWYDQEEDKSI